jgi:hypothetical protein
VCGRKPGRNLVRPTQTAPKTSNVDLALQVVRLFYTSSPQWGKTRPSAVSLTRPLAALAPYFSPEAATRCRRSFERLVSAVRPPTSRL